MQRPQWILMGIALSLVALMYFGCPTQAPEMVQVAASRSLEVEATSPQALIRAARTDLTPVAKATLGSLEDELRATETEEAKRPLYEKMAGEWYRAGHPAISGHYAQLIAEQLDTVASAWSTVGTTFSICVQQAEEEKEKTFCTQRAIKAYQAAISLKPTELDNRLNLALTYTYNPPADNPMQGILMLRELEQQFPDDARVLVTLAQLAIKTNQFERAGERLAKAVELDPTNAEAHCLLGRVQETLGQKENAAASAQKCIELRSNS